MFCTVSSVFAEDWVYTVKPGDTVWDISHTQLKDWRYWNDILRQNNIANAAKLQPGTKISIPLYIVREAVSEVRVEDVQGRVDVISGRNGKTLPLKIGMSLTVGDRVLTAEKSTAQLSLEDKSTILLQENSELEFTRLKALGGGNQRSLDARLNMRKGRMNMSANPSHQPDSMFEILTVSANSAVRGTTFRIGIEKDSSRTEVLDGLISVENSMGSVDVPGNFGTVARKGSPPIKPIKLLPAPDLAKFPLLIRYLPKVVALNSLSNAVGYRVQIAQDRDFRKIVQDRVIRQRLMIDQSLSDGTYFARVRGVDGNGLEGNNAVAEFRVDARPAAPMVRSPLSETALYAGNIEFSWADVEGVDHYLFEIAKDEAFSEVVVKESISDTSYSVDLKEAEYFYRLSSVTSGGRQGPPGKGVQIRVRPIPAVPEPKPPAVEGDRLRLAWQSVEGISNYQVQLATDADFQSIAVDEKTADPRIEIRRPASGYYYFRLRSIDSEGYVGAYSTPQRFEVEPESYLPLILFVLGSALLLL
jgi:hypothetical protein